MIKSVLLSIRPEWCKKILGGEKTTEIRKSRPNLETPFRCYIYCAMPVGNVIGEFTCDRIRFYSGKSWLAKEDVESVTAGSCLSLEQVKEYAGWRKAASFMDRKDLYAWHIFSIAFSSVILHPPTVYENRKREQESIHARVYRRGVRMPCIRKNSLRDHDFRPHRCALNRPRQRK